MSPVRRSALKRRLDALVATADYGAYRAADPVSFVHAYADPADQEIVGLVAALLAFGQVVSVRRSVARVLDALGPAPSRAAQERPLDALDSALAGFVHRVYRGGDVARMVHAAGALQRTHGSLGARFALALPVADQQAIEPWVSRIKELFQRPVDVRGIPLYADVVVGAAYHPNHGHRARDLLQKASTALLHARDLTGRFCAYRPALDNDYQETLFLLAELSLAFERKELSLHYQPIVELSSGRLMTVEALFRWKHPRRGWIPPVQVLPAAEETGLIEPLTD